MDERDLKNIVEAALLAAGRPLSIEQLCELFAERDCPQAPQLRAALKTLAADYEGRGIELKEVASGFRIQIRRTMSETVSRLWQERPMRYSRALLETLALIAYRQPITRSEIEEIRGVAVNPNIVRTLLERNWIHIVGHREVPGRPELLGTTHEFLDYFNLKRLEDLPTLAELRDMDNVGVQLELPDGDTPAVRVEPDPDASEIEYSAAAEENDEEEGEEGQEQSSEMVARGAEGDDDPHYS